MTDVRTALLESLRADEQAARDQLRAALKDVDLAAARLAAKDDPGSAEAAARVLGAMLLGGAGKGELIDAAKAAAQRAPRDEAGNAVALLAGTVLWRLGDQPQLAEPYFRRVRRSDPAHHEVLAFYRELFSADGAATQLIQVLVQARRSSKDAEVRFALAEEVAELAERRLSSPDRAIEMWRSVIREDGYDPRASRALERLYRESGKWTALVDLLKDEIERIGDGPEHAQVRIAKLLEIATLYRERLKLDTMALATLQRILEIDPRHEPSLEALAETYANAGRYNDLLGVYARRIEAAEQAGDVGRRVALLRKVAEIWVDRLGNPQRALEPLEQVLQLAPRDPDARRLLAHIHEQRRDFRALIALRREELAEKTGDEALALRMDLAKLAEERLGDRREAIEAWNEVLVHHGDVDRALAALARLYERESRWASAAEILHRKLATCERDEAIALLNHLGGLYSDRLHSREDAIAVWSELLRLVPGHDKATRRLRDAYIADRRWDDLTDLYDRQDRLHDVVEVLQSAADRISDVEERVSLYRRVAALCEGRLGEPERAVKALERTLAIQPDNLEVARELLPIYREQSNWARLMSTYEVLLKAAQDDDARLEVIGAMQEIAEHKLASPTLTLHWAAEAYKIRPSDRVLLEGLERAAEKADGWDDLTRIYEERIAAEDAGDDERRRLLEKLAVIARDRLFKPDDAQRYFRRIIAVDPNSTEAMAALEEIYSSTRRWDDLSEVYRRRLEVTTDVQARLSTLRALAKLQERQLGDLDGATESYRAIVELAADDEAALTSLARIHRVRGNWAELAAVLERKLELTVADTARVPIVFELGQIHATRLQQPDQAVSEFLAVLEIEPEHRGAVEALESLRQAEPSTSLPIMRGLLPYYRRVDDRPREAEAMEVIVAAEDDETERLRLYEQLAAIYEKMTDRREDALRIRERLFRADPSQWQTRQVLARLGQELGALSTVAGAYEAVLAQIAAEAAKAEEEGTTLPRERATLRRDLLLEYAAILRDRLGRPQDAERAFAEVLDQDETHQGAYEALEALLRQRNANEELVALYRRRVDVTFNQREQKELLSRITDIARRVLGDRRTAIATAEELLDLIPDDLPTIQLLAEMYAEGTDGDDHAKLEEILGRQAELTSDAAACRKLMVRRAALRMQYLGDAFGAVDLLGQVVGEDPSDAEARRLLEELLGISDVQLQACALLEPIYESVGDHEGRIRVLHVRRGHAESIGSTDEAVSHLLSIARIREHEMSDAFTAFEAVREAFLMDPRRLDTRDEVERLGKALRLYKELVEVWQRALRSELVTDPALRIDLCTRVARLLDQNLRDQEAARMAYSDLLALDPPDVRLAHEAVEALCRLHLEAGDGVALVEAKRELLRFLDNASEQVRVRLEIADIQEQLRDRVGAALTYSEVLDMEPANARALEALERLFLEEQEWARLIEVLEHRIGVTPDPRGRAALWRQIGELMRHQVRDAQRAIDAFQSILDLKVGRDDTAFALRSLIELNSELERWPDVEEGLRRLTTIAESNAQRAELLTRTAMVVGRKLGRGHDALDLLKRVLDLAPTDTRARSEVGTYLEADDTRDRAIRILTPLYEAEQNWPALLELEELQARKQPSGRRRLQALLKVARTQEERIGDTDRAFGVLCEAMAEAADQPELEEILEKVERLGAEPERAERLLDAYAATVDHILDAGLQQRVLRSQGQVALERLGRLPVARAAYERLLELAPDDGPAADALEHIYLRQDAYEPLAELLVGRADRAQDDVRRDEYLIRAAEIQRTHLDRPEEAIDLYERLSAEGLARPEVQAVLEPLYEATERYRELAAHLNRKLAHLTGKEAVDTHLRLGRLYGQRLEDPEAGIRHLSAAIKLDPDHAVATEELDRYLEDPSMRVRVAEMLEPVFAAVADWARLIQIQEIRLEEAVDDETRVRLLLRIAQIEEEQLEDLERAMKSYTRLFREQPTMRYVRDQLARLATVLGQTQQYAELLTEYAQGDGASDDRDESLAVAREAADLWAGILRQPARAVPLLTRLVNARPDDRSAFSGLEAALTQAEMWKELAEAYWREIDGSMDEDRQVELLRKLATLAQEMLDDPEEAARAYQRTLEIRPDNELARTRLEQIYASTQRHADLLELLRERMMRSDSPQRRSEIAVRIAELQNEQLDDPEGAVDTLEAVLADLPDDPHVVAMLERIAQGRRAMRPRVLAILRPIYERTGNVRRLVEVDEWQLTQTQDPVARHELFREMADLLLRSNETAEAGFRALCRALAEPGPFDVLESLDAEVGRVAEVLDLRGALADALVSAAASPGLESDLDRRLALLVRSGRIQQELGNLDRAVETLRTALELAPDHEPALALMDVALTRLGHHEALGSVLRRRVEASADDRERVELLRRLGRLLEEVLALREDAEVVWKQLLDIEPSDPEALRRLSSAYAASGSTRELIEVLERRIEASLDPSERRDLRMQLASIHREAVKDRAAEIDVLRALLMEAPSDDDALAALGRALLAEERYAEAADVLQERATLAPSDERRAALVLEAARIYVRSLEDVATGLERYESVLQIMPGQDGAISDLIELAQKRDAFEAAGSLVIPQLEQKGRWSDLAVVLQARTELSNDPEERAEALRHLARIRIERLDDVPGALAAYDRLLDGIGEADVDAVLEQIGRLAAQAGQIAEQVDRVAARSANADLEPAVRIRLARFAAQLAEDALGDPARALTILSPLVGSGLVGVELCLEVERLGGLVGDLASVEQALREAVRLTTDAPTQGAMLVRLGEALLSRGDQAAAREAFREAFDVNADPAAVRGLERILDATEDEPEASLLDALDVAYQSTGNRVGQARITRARLRLIDPADPDRVRLLELLGQVQDDGGGTPDEALETWGELLGLDPDSRHALDRVLSLSRGTPRMGRAVQLMRDAVERGRESGRDVTRLVLQTASVLVRDVGDPQGALDVLDQVLADQPDHADALELMVECARQAGDAPKLHEALVRSAQIKAEPELAVALWWEAAVAAENQLADPMLAIDDLENLLRIEESEARAWQKLLALLTASGEHDRLAEALTRRVGIAERPEERRELRYRLANLLVDKLDRTEDAIAVYQDMLTDGPDDLEAMGELEIILRRLERWQDVRDVLERRLDVVEGDARVAVLEDLAQLAENRLEDRLDAIERYQQIQLESPGHAKAEKSLERLFAIEERWTDLSELLEQRRLRQQSNGDVDGWRHTSSELAQLLAERLEHPERAQEILGELLEHDPSYVPALLARAAVYEVLGDHGASRLTLQKAIEQNPQGAEGAAVYLRLARLAEGDPPKRLEYLEAALQLDPGNAEAARDLVELYRGQQRWDQLAYLLDLAAGRAKDEALRRSLLLERVDVMLDRLQDVNGALQVLAQLYKDIQDDTEINRRIADALFQAERYEEAAGMYTWLVEVGRSAKRNKMLAHHLTRLARIAMRQQDRNGAKDHLLEAYRIDTTNVETLITLGTFYEEHEDWKEALKIYRTMLLQNADQSGLLRRGDIYVRLARAHLALEEKPKAKAMLRRGLEEDADHPELRRELAALED